MKFAKYPKSFKGNFICVSAWLLQVASVLLSFAPTLSVNEIFTTQYTVWDYFRLSDQTQLFGKYNGIFILLFLGTLSLGMFVFLSREKLIPALRIPHSIIFAIISFVSTIGMVEASATDDIVSLSLVGWLYILVTVAAFILALFLSSILKSIPAADANTPNTTAVPTQPAEVKTLENLKEIVHIEPGADLTSYKKRALLFCEMGEFARAVDYCEAILDKAPDDADTYIVRMMAELSVREYDKLPEYYMFFGDTASYEYVLRFATPGQLNFLHSKNEN